MHIAHWQNYVVGGPCVSFLFFSWRAELQAIHCPNILIRKFSDSTVVYKQLSALADEKQWESNIRAIVQHSAAVPGGLARGKCWGSGLPLPPFPCDPCTVVLLARHGALPSLWRGSTFLSHGIVSTVFRSALLVAVHPSWLTVLGLFSSWFELLCFSLVAG